MRDSDQDIVRRVLSSVLDGLERGARAESEIIGGANANLSTNDQSSHPLLTEKGGGDNPIIMIFLGQSNATPEAAHRIGVQQGEAVKEMSESLASGSAEKRFAFDRREMQAVHPGLEKFAIDGSRAAPPAPKSCFMEPGRVCVNSGACEMRGY